MNARLSTALTQPPHSCNLPSIKSALQTKPSKIQFHSGDGVILTTMTSSLLRTRIRDKSVRPEGGIEPLRLSAPTGLKPATRTTECHLDMERGKNYVSKLNDQIHETIILIVWRAGELWSNRVLLILENYEDCVLFKERKKKI